MKLELTKLESEDFFHASLCNGLSYIGGYGLKLKYDAEEYQKSRDIWKSNNSERTCCFEDVLMQMLKDGYKLTLHDYEYDGEYTKSITLDDVHNRVQLTPIRHLLDMVNENDDAITAEVIMQTVFFEDVIFG